MATTERNALITFKDEGGNKTLIYPITKADNVDGLESPINKAFASHNADEMAHGGRIKAASDAIQEHAGDGGRHITAAERTAWNEKAAAGHKHSAADLTSGTVPVSRGGTGATTQAAARTALGAAASNHTHTPSSIGAAPAYTYGTTGLTAGTSTLANGTLYFQYE